MPPSKPTQNSGTLLLHRSRVTRQQKVISTELDAAEQLAGKLNDTGDDDLITPNDQAKLSSFFVSLESNFKAYDEFCDRLAGTLDRETLESSEEIQSCTEFIFSARDRVAAIKMTTTLPPISSAVKAEPDMYPSPISDLHQQMSELIQLNKETHNQTQSLLSAQNRALQHQSISQSTQATQPVKVNLPKLQIPTFTGDVMKWTEFQDMFKTSVDNHQGLSDVQKFTYLRDHLGGLAKDTISGLPLTGGNYAVAVSLLTSRFGDSQVIINAHHVALMDLPNCSASTKKLRTFYDAVEIHLRSLAAAGQDTAQLVFLPMITSKLPKSVLVQLELQKGPTPWTVTNLRTALGQYVSAQEAAERQCPTTADVDRPTYSSGQVLTTHKPAATTTASAAAVTCAFCKQKHYSDDCTTYRTVDARKKQAPDRCFKCLRYGHSSQTCNFNRRCYYCGKSGQHHRSFCPSKFGKPNHSMNINAEPFQPTPATSVVLGQDEEVLMQTALVNVLTPAASSVQARILFDTGSSRSFVTESLQKRAQLHVTDTETISLATFGDQKRRTTEFTKILLQFPTNNGSVQDITACVTPHITSPIRRIAIDTTKHPSLHDLPLAEPLTHTDERLHIDILIGLDHYYDIIGSDRLVYPDGLLLLDSTLGFIRAGKVTTEAPPSVSEGQSCLVHQPNPYQDPDFDLKRFWSVEDLGKFDDREVDDLALQQFKENIRFEEGRYEVRWPWRDDHDILPSNYGLAIGRLNSLLKRLSTKPNLLNQYDTVISDQLKKGIIEPAPVVPTSPHTHYLPHHCVVKPSHNTTKVRVVYDASAKASKQSPSLNDCLLSGPNLVPDLCGVLLRFRLPRIAISSDIEKAFLQLSLHDEDRDVTRFLWLRDVSLPATPENIQTFRFCRVPFGVVSSPFLLAATVHHHLKNSTCKDAPEHLKNIYVDNLFSGADTDNEAMKQYNSTKKLFSKASMNLREWASNSPIFLQQIPEADRTTTSVQKCLGLLWDTTGDTISSSPVDTTSIAVTTKRHVLQAVSKFFDPLGLQSPVLVQAKILMQDIWKLDVDWDDPLPDDTLQHWISIAADLETASSTSYPRFVGAPDPSNASYELHVFCDASASAYGAAVYLTVISDDHRTTNLLFSKSRVAPVQAQTIPRLELMAALLGANVTRFIRKELPLTFRRSYLWSDSTTVLHWLASTEKLPVFVKNRVEAIRAVPHLTYQYVKSCDNPADLPSRGATVSTLQSSNLWWHGPAFLSVSSDQPVILAAGEDPTETTPESSKGSKGLGKSQLAQTKKKSDAHHQQIKICDESPFGIDVERFSSFTTLVRVTALCTRFLCRLRKTESAVGPITVPEIERAKDLWIKHVQRQYADVHTALKLSKPHPLIGKLNLYLDSKNLIRCRGRLENADIPLSAIHPILMPRSHIADLIIRDCHHQTMHAGVPHTLAKVRQTYWVPKGRSTVKSAIIRCLTCKRHHGGPYSLPNMAPLPSSRVTPARAFARTGIDFFGPLYVRGSSESTKVWVCLFSCMVTRAVHLELVMDMSTTEFLLAFRRFVARRGSPELVTTDNAPQFKVADSVFRKAFADLSGTNNVLYNCISFTEVTDRVGGIEVSSVSTVQ